MAGIAYSLLTRAIIRSQGSGSLLSKAVGKSRKGNVSLALYVFAVAVALWAPYVAGLIYSLVAVMWLIPDRRIERALGERSQ